MSYLGFVFFSTLENLSFVIFVLSLFRFSLQENLLKFGVFSVVLSLVSNSLQTESLQAVSALIQAVILVCFVAFLLRIHIFNSMIMVITGYVINYIVQWVTIIGVIHFTGHTEIEPYTTESFVIQSISSLMMLLISLFIHWQKGGFSFIDHQSRSKRSKIFVKENRPLFLLITFSVILTFAANFLLYRSSKPPYLMISILLFVALIGLMFLCLQRDAKDNG
ncbi:hypothetical protein [Cohnella candidum]|nr:hypothetical protein [Cohnella candidum]